MTATEQEAWRTDLLSVVDFPAGCRVLEVGAGTGAFTRLLAEWGCQVVGLEASAAMLAEAAKRLPASLAPRVEFHLGDTHQPELFRPATFDWLVGRHVVSHLYDLLAAFHNWAAWLRPNGGVLVLEGFWPREDWDDLVDRLPLCCLRTRATIAYLLEQAGFAIQANTWLERVNAHFASMDQGPQQQYLILARRAA